MDGDYGNDFITIADDDGNEYELEHLDTAELNGNTYMAFLPADMDEDDDDFGMVILKVVIEDDEEEFVSVDNDAELDAVYKHFVKKLFGEE